MSVPRLGADVGEYLGSSLALPLKPLLSGWLSSLFHTMVPTGYSKLQEERLAMVDLGPEAVPVHNGYRQEPSHVEGRRLLDRAARSSMTLSDPADGAYSETAPMLSERRLSADETDGRDEDDKDEGPGSGVHNMPKESPLAMALQILVPFLLAGFGTVSAGMVLDVVQVSPAAHSSHCVCENMEIRDSNHTFRWESNNKMGF